MSFCSCAQPCLTLCNPVDSSPPESSVHWISRARILEWVASSFSWGIFPTQGLNPGLPHSRQTLPSEPPGKLEKMLDTFLIPLAARTQAWDLALSSGTCREICWGLLRILPLRREHHVMKKPHMPSALNWSCEDVKDLQESRRDRKVCRVPEKLTPEP